MERPGSVGLSSSPLHSLCTKLSPRRSPQCHADHLASVLGDPRLADLEDLLRDGVEECVVRLGILAPELKVRWVCSIDDVRQCCSYWAAVRTSHEAIVEHGADACFLVS